MSMEEIDQAMMDMVNGKQESEERIATASSKPRNDSEETERVLKRIERRLKIKMVTWALICIAAAAALVVALYVPAALPWVVNIGVMCFIVAAAIIADRSFRRWLM